MTEKVKFKDWRLYHKIFVPTYYGLIAFGAMATACAIKQKKDPTGPILGTGAALLWTPLCHADAIDEARRKKQRQRD